MIFNPDFTAFTRNELLETLYAFSQPAKEQWLIIGPPFPGEEMLVDFFREYADLKPSYQHFESFTPEQFAALDQIESVLRAIAKRPDAQDVCLDPERLGTEPVWDELRTMTHAVLLSLGLDPTEMEPVVEIEQHGSVVVHRWQLKAKTEDPGL